MESGVGVEPTTSGSLADSYDCVVPDTRPPRYRLRYPDRQLVGAGTRHALGSRRLAPRKHPWAPARHAWSQPSASQVHPQVAASLRLSRVPYTNPPGILAFPPSVVNGFGRRPNNRFQSVSSVYAGWGHFSRTRASSRASPNSPAQYHGAHKYIRARSSAPPGSGRRHQVHRSPRTRVRLRGFGG